MLTLTFNCDSAAELVQEFQKLNNLTTMQPTGAIDASSIPLDALIEIVRQRLRDDGFKLEVIDQREPSPAETPVEAGQQPEPPAQPETTAPKTRKGKGAKNEPAEPVDAPDDVDALMSPSKSKTPLDAPVDEPEAIPDTSDPEGDRQFTLDTLVTMRENAKAKPKVDAFIAKMSKKHGTAKMFEIDAKHFPAIRVEMMKEFPNAPKSAA